MWDFLFRHAHESDSLRLDWGCCRSAVRWGHLGKTHDLSFPHSKGRWGEALGHPIYPMLAARHFRQEPHKKMKLLLESVEPYPTLHYQSTTCWLQIIREEGFFNLCVGREEYILPVQKGEFVTSFVLCKKVCSRECISTQVHLLRCCTFSWHCIGIRETVWTKITSVFIFLKTGYFLFWFVIFLF